MKIDASPVWLITGCSTGFGAALAKHVLHSGHRLAATARKPASLSYLTDSDNVLKLALDVTIENSITSAFTAALGKFGRLDYVVSNAGYGIFVEAEATSKTEARDIFETNFWGSANVAVEAVKIFRDHNPPGAGGMLIQISSLLGRVGAGGQTYYSSSKFAIEGFIESLSKELHPKWNIKVLIAEPGAIKSTAFNANITNPRAIYPAYRDDDCPTNKTRQWLASPNLEEDFTPASEMATTLFEAVSGVGLPLRLPLGKDSLDMITKDVSEALEKLVEWRATSEIPTEGA